MPQVAETAHLSEGDVATKAQRLWVAMREDAVRRKMPTIMTKFGAGYYLMGTVQSYGAKLWGSALPEMRTLRAFLKVSGNVVVVEQHRTAAGANESKIFVRNEWNPAVAVPVPMGGSRGDRIDVVAARLTPEEAGETRPDPPVEVRRKAPNMGPVPETIELANGMFRCGACGTETTSTASMGSHKRKHYHERMRARVTTSDRPQPTPVQGLRGEAALAAPAESLSTARPIPTPGEVLPHLSTAVIKESLRRAIDLVDHAMSDEQSAEAFLAENLQLSETVTTLKNENVRLKDENDRLVEEIRATLAEPKADEATLRRLSSAESLIELIRGVVARYTRAEAGPVRTLTDVEDLLA